MLKLRSRAHSATTLLKDYQEFFKGLSYDIGVACCDVKEIRASVTTTTEAERHRSGVHGGDYSTVRQSPSLELPPISCTMEMRSVTRPQSDLSDHLHAGCMIRHAAASATHAHAPCGQHVIEVDLTELSDSVPATFLGRRIPLDTASSFLTDQTTNLQWNSDCPQDASPHIRIKFPDEKLLSKQDISDNESSPGFSHARIIQVSMRHWEQEKCMNVCSSYIYP
ncbi:hypothetical protein AZE42_09000 [Rhizopogon vesiculosus]|uniref:Uncharacterized protein n=1 Tax=Rhizopogon vesiculosus TaxID=180088 RepID=A0A1J8Q2W5_9AGAM|nr:hypothetical protein AZE42_09000 [Rhizopogon vesiculosus]